MCGVEVDDVLVVHRDVKEPNVRLPERDGGTRTIHAALPRGHV